MATSSTENLPPTFANAQTRGDQLVHEIEDTLARVQVNDPDIDYEFLLEVRICYACQ